MCYWSLRMRAEKIFEETMSKNFPNLVKEKTYRSKKSSNPKHDKPKGTLIQIYHNPTAKH